MRDEKQRQKLRERRRKKREQKRRMSPPVPGGLEPGGPGPGGRKLSDTLLEFITPVLAVLPEEQREPEEMQELLELAADIWNAVVALVPADREARLAELSRFHARQRGRPEDKFAELVNELAARKLAYFAHDPRVVLGVRTGWGSVGEEIRISAAGIVFPPGSWIPAPPLMSIPPRGHGRDDRHPRLQEGEGADTGR